MSAREIVGGTPLRGAIRPPGDKSISHRALLCGALAEGTNRIEHLADGADVRRTYTVLEHLGTRLQTAPDGAVTVRGHGPDELREPTEVLDCGNSGSTARMLLGVLAARPFHAVLDGDSSLRARPMGRVVEPLQAMGAHIDGRAGGEQLPLAVRGGALAGRSHDLAVASAQVKTALLLAGLQAEGATVVREPAPSRDHTERLLAELGAPIERLDDRTTRITRGALRPFELDVPGDPSSAAFWAVAATLVPQSELAITDVALNPTRLGFVDVLRRMGADLEVVPVGVRLGEPVGDLLVRAAPLRGTTIGGPEVPALVDELPVLAVAAACAEGTTEVRDAGELRVKETDRIAALDQELVGLGARVEAHPDGFTVHGGPRLHGGVCKSHGDHRIAMACAVAALAAEGTTTVRGWRAVAVSYPGFLDDLAALRDGP